MVKGKDMDLRQVGLHILSGNVFEPHALDELIPDWKAKVPPPPLSSRPIL